jgi:cytochrome c oxidase assembly protein subunit 15
MMGHGEGLLNLIDNRVTIHFIHRGLAYLLLILIIILTIRLIKTSGSSLIRKTRWMPLALVMVQVVLGILSVLTSIKIVPGHWGQFEWMAQLHQFVAMLLLLSLVWVIYLAGRRSTN